MEQYVEVSVVAETVFGQIIQCRSKDTNEMVVIKSVDLKRAQDANNQLDETNTSSSLADKVSREREMTALLSQAGEHPNIVNTKEIFYDAKRMYLVMEHCSNGDLFSYVALRRRLDRAQIILMFRQIVAGVAHLHAFGYAHRDISLENVLITEDHVCKLCDFGLAVSIKKKCHDRVGKFNYMAPELCKEADPPLSYSARETDIWALGILLYVLLSGNFLFRKAVKGDPHFDYFRYNSLEDMVVGYGLSDRIPAAAIDLIERMLKLEPSKRLGLDEVLNHPFLHGETSEESLNRVVPKTSQRDHKSYHLRRTDSAPAAIWT